MSARTVMVRIRGRVQGVGFRYWTAQQARELGLAGWVRNEPDGSVAALLGGSDEAVADMLARLRQGPRGAVVSDIAVEPAEAQDVSGDFRIIR